MFHVFGGGRCGKRNAQRTRLALEVLEDRTMPAVSAANVLAQFPTTVAAPGGTNRINYAVTPTDFTSYTGKVLLGFLLQAEANSTLDPAAAQIRDARGQMVGTELVRPDLANRSQSLVLASLPWGTYQITLAGERGTTGVARLDVFLAGDSDGDHAVTLNDGILIAKAVGATAGNRRYQVESDNDRNGQIDPTDLLYWARNYGNGVRFNSLNLDVQLAPAPAQLADGTAVTNHPLVDVMGTTSAGALVALETGSDGRFDDGATQADAAGKFTFHVTLKEGANTLQVRGRDAAGRQQTASLAVVLDTTAPAVQAQLFQDTGSDTGDRLTANGALTGSSSDNHALSSVQVRVDTGTSMPLTVDSAGKFAYTPVGLADGAHTAQFLATDAAGNQATAVVSFTLDTTAPALTVQLKNDTGASASDGVTQDPALAGTVTDKNGPVTLEVRMDSGGYSPAAVAADGTWTFAPAHLDDGDHTARLRVTDRAGNVTESAVSFTLDTQAPAVLVTSPGAGLLTNSNPTFAGQVTDERSGVAFLEARVDSAAFGSVPVNGTGGFSYPLTFAVDGTADGSHTVALRATDRAGNVANAVTVAFTLDTLAPAAPIFDLDPAFDSAPVGDRQTTFATATLQGQTEAHATVRLQPSGAVATADNTGRFRFPGVPLALGANDFTVTATDAAGNGSVSHQTISRLLEDTEPPVIVVGLTNDTAPGGLTDADRLTSDPALTGTVTDAHRIIDFRAGFDTTPTTSFANVFPDLHADGGFAFDRARLVAINGGLLADGLHTVHLTATDEFGNRSGPVNLAFTLDTQAPTVLIDSPAPGLSTFQNITVTGQATDTLAGLATLEVQVDTGPFTPVIVDAASRFSFTTSLALDNSADGVHTVRLRATDRAGNISSPALVTFMLDTITPPDPSLVAPNLDRSVETSVFDSSAFLYTGADPIQTGVAAGVINPVHVAVLRGKVLDRDGNPLPRATVAILGHPEFGSTLSRADGMFDLAVNGGGQLTVTYTRAGYLPAQRQADPDWQEFTWLQDVRLLLPDTQVTTVDLSAAVPIQVAQGSAVSDMRGNRQATLLFAQGTQATAQLPGGGTQPLTTLHVRATEYTVGAGGPDAMPAALPAASAYTYAVAFTVDEAAVLGAATVQFSRPVISYTQNFLGFTVGTTVPVGYYDSAQGVWVPAPNGLVIKIVSITGGRANLDVTGDGKADAADTAQFAALGITDAERQQLAALYAPGQGLWRVPLTHFTIYDCNWGWYPPADAAFPKQPAPDPNQPVDGANPVCGGSVIEAENQILGETVPLVGTPFTLHYQSDRTTGYRPPYQLTIPLSGPDLPKSILGIVLQVEVGGRLLTPYALAGDSNSLANQTVVFDWDGLNAYGKLVQGRQAATVRVGYVYQLFYSNTLAGFGSPGTGQAITVALGSQTTTYWQIHKATIGTWTALPTGLGGWELDVHDAYSPAAEVFYQGDGTRRSEEALHPTITTVAGGPLALYNNGIGDGRPATQVDFAGSRGLTVGPDGSIYVADSGNSRIRKIGPDGIVSTVAGISNGHDGSFVGPGFSGDGGPATAAKLNTPYDVAVGPDGSLYIADASNNRIRRVAPNGIITTVAGTGTAGFSGDGGPATAARLRFPTSVAVGPDGSLYIADSSNNRIRRVAPDGTISTVAYSGFFAYYRSGTDKDGFPIYAEYDLPLSNPQGITVGPDGSVYIADTDNYVIRKLTPDGTLSVIAGMTDQPFPPSNFGFSGDGGPALGARFHFPTDVALGPDGSLFVADSSNNRVRRIDTHGIITTIAGNGVGNSTYQYEGEGGYATAAVISAPRKLAVGPDGSVYVDGLTERINRIAPALPGFGFDDIVMPSADGSELYVFDKNGRHLRTVAPLTGATLFEFHYDSKGHLTEVVDKRGGGALVTKIQHDAAGKPTAIIGPYGDTTTFTVRADGYLASVTNPAGETYAFDYAPGTPGLLTAFTHPDGNSSTMEYDAEGRLTRDNAADCGCSFKVFTRTEQDDGWTVSVQTTEGTVNAYQFQELSTGGVQRTDTLADGSKVQTLLAADGTMTVTFSDGTRAQLTPGADPRFAMLAPTVQSFQESTPGGKTLTETESRTVSLSNPDDVFSVQSATDNVTINGKTWTSTYDGATRTITAVSPLGRKVVTTLDAQGDVLSETIAGIDGVQIHYDTNGRIDQVKQGDRVYVFTYGANGQLATVQNPLGDTVSLTYDLAGRVIKEQLPGGSQIGFGYDANGNLTSLTPPGRPPHQFVYDKYGHLIEYIAPAVGLIATTTTYDYDNDGRLQLVTRPDGLTIDPEYDTAGRLSTLTTPDRTVTYVYGASGPSAGHVTQINATDGVNLALGYDGPLTTDVTWSGTVAGTVHWTYDNNFRVAGESVDGAPAVAYTYDNDGLLSNAGALTLTRNAQNGSLSGTTLGNVADTYSYDNFGEVKDYSATYAGTAKLTAHYVFDALGRISQKTESVNGEAAHTYTYKYDALGQLTDVMLDGNLYSHYEYDANGNRTSYTGPAGMATGSYDDQDRMKSYGGAAYTYTANGELKSKTAGLEVTTYDYDVEGNLRKVALPDGTQITYAVDGANRRVGKAVNGVLVQGFLYHNGLTPVAELDGSGAVVARFVYGSRGNAPDYMIKNGATYRIVNDQLGSVRLVIDAATGAVVQRMDYDEFGKILQDSNPGFQPFGFAGGLYDRDTGLVRFGARDYDAETGRWTAKDSIRFGGGDSNLYRYGGNDPVNTIDPNGHNPILALAIVVIVAATTIRSDSDVSTLEVMGLAASFLPLTGAVRAAASGALTKSIEMGSAACESMAARVAEEQAWEFSNAWVKKGAQGLFVEIGHEAASPAGRQRLETILKVLPDLVSNESDPQVTQYFSALEAAIRFQLDKE